MPLISLILLHMYNYNYTCNPCKTAPQGLINYIDTKAKWCHLKKITCKGTKLQVFITVERLEILSFILVFSTQLCELLPL
jgi:hypothetical protein